MRAANTTSRTRPSTRETRVMADTSPAARAIRAFSFPALTSAAELIRLAFCSRWEEMKSGTPRVGPEADAAEREAPGPQPEEPLPAQDPAQEAPLRRRRGQRRGREQAPPRDRGRDRQGGEEGRRPRQRRRAVQEPPRAQGHRTRRGQVAR